MTHSPSLPLDVRWQNVCRQPPNKAVLPPALGTPQSRNHAGRQPVGNGWGYHGQMEFQETSNKHQRSPFRFVQRHRTGQNKFVKCPMCAIPNSGRRAAICILILALYSVNANNIHILYRMYLCLTIKNGTLSVTGNGFILSLKLPNELFFFFITLGCFTVELPVLHPPPFHWFCEAYGTSLNLPKIKK